MHLVGYILESIKKVKVKVKINPRTGHAGTEGEQRYSTILSLTLRRLMSYIYGAPILDVSRSHTTTQHSR